MFALSSKVTLVLQGQYNASTLKQLHKKSNVIDRNNGQCVQVQRHIVYKNVRVHMKLKQLSLLTEPGILHTLNNNNNNNSNNNHPAHQELLNSS